MEPIVIPFAPNNLGRVIVIFDAEVLTGDFKSFKKVQFKLDSGSDFTTLSCKALNMLGYSEEFLKKCPYYETDASVASDEIKLQLQYISNVSIKFGERELQGCRIFFAWETKLHSLFGSDILKYFNREVNYDKGEIRLTEIENKPQLSEKENILCIYSIENL